MLDKQTRLELVTRIDKLGKENLRLIKKIKQQEFKMNKLVIENESFKDNGFSSYSK